MNDNEVRLIDANTLKKDIAENSIILEGVWAIEVECAKSLIDNAPTVEITETDVQEILTKSCMTAVTNEYLIALHNNYHEGYKKGLEDGKAILIKVIKERLEKRRCAGNEEEQGQ